MFSSYSPTISEFRSPHALSRRSSWPDSLLGIDRVLADLLRSPLALPRTPVLREDADGSFVAELALPGVDPTRISVSASDRTVTVSVSEAKGEGSTESTSEQMDSCVAAFVLPRSAELSSISATSEHGLLTLRMRREKPETRRIEVKTIGEQAGGPP